MLTSRFGEIDIDENLVFTFIEPLIGYEEYTKYVLIEHKADSLFTWLQSTEKGDLAFPLTSPAMFEIEYEFEIPDEEAAKINLESVENLIALNVVNIPNNNPQGSTINLLAPIIINASNKLGMQMILSNANDTYNVRYPLFAGKNDETQVSGQEPA